METGVAPPALPCHREAIHKIIPAWIVIRYDIAESDVSKAITLDSLGDRCLAESDSLCCAVCIPPPTFVMISTTAIRVIAADVTSNTGSAPATRILVIPLASARSTPFEIDGITFATALRVVDPKNNPAPGLPRILKELNATSPIDSAESEGSAGRT